VTLQDLIALFRKQVQDTAKPYLFDDDEVLTYLIDAQDMFVRAVGGISDYSTAAITDLVVTESVATTKFSPYILRIRSAKLLTSKRAVQLISEADLAQAYTDDYGIRRSLYLDDDHTGQVVAGVLGVEDHKIRWYPVPNLTEICRLHVYRLPYPRIKDENSCLEIEEQHHLHLLKWVKHMAYSKEDAETYDKNLADKNEAAFMAYCEQARQEKERQRYKPRIVHYGGL
jgi:hypothetical protein